MKTIEFQTPTGKNARVYIQTETENLADHNFKAKCFDFVLEVDGLGKWINPIVDGGNFRTAQAVYVPGHPKRVLVHVTAPAEAIALHDEYRAERTRRIEANIKAEREYQDHHQAVIDAMDP